MRDLIYIFLILLTGCSSSKQSEQPYGQTQLMKGHFSINDSLFYKKNAREFKWSSIKAIEKNSKPLYSTSDSIRKQLFDCLDIKSEILGVDYYSPVKSEEGLTAFVALVSTMESKSLMLITTSDGSNIISCVQLTENRCDLVEQHEDSEEIWCDVKEAYLTDSNELQLIHVFTKEFDYGEYSKVEKDSITSIYTFISSGALSLKARDSLRIEYRK